MAPMQPRAGTELVLARDEQQMQVVTPMSDSTEEEGSTISVAQVLAILKAYWKVSLVLFLVVVVGAAVVTKLMAKTYTATATLLTSFDSTDPLATREPSEGYAMYASSFLPTQIELMQSPEVLDEVIVKLNLTALPEFAGGNRGGEATLRDWVETRLRGKIMIYPGMSGSQFLYVAASASRNDLAADIANGIVDVYVNQLHANANVPSMERAARYSEELEDLKKKVQQAQDAFTRFRTTAGSVDIDAKNDVESDLLSTLEHRLLDARTALQSSQARAGERTEPTSAFLASSTVAGLREEGSKLAAHMAQLRASLGPNHPEVLALQSQIESNKAALAAAMSTYSRANSSDVAISGTEVASLEKAVAMQREKVLQSRLRHDEAAKYELELESAQAVYKRALDGYDQTKFAAARQSPNVRIATRARPPVKADHPNPIKNMAMGVGMGLALGLLVPFGLELPRRKIRCRNDLEGPLGIPVLAELSSLGVSAARQAS
jgi:succinoglycan biosynthesis transport protein ExoP